MNFFPSVEFCLKTFNDINDELAVDVLNFFHISSAVGKNKVACNGDGNYVWKGKQVQAGGTPICYNYVLQCPWIKVNLESQKVKVLFR